MAEVTKEDRELWRKWWRSDSETGIADIAAYREQCERAARDEVVKRVRSAACKDCKAGVKLDSGWRGGSWFHVGNVPGYKVWRCPIDPKIHEALDPDGRLAGGAK